jgi:hypothetical protein
LFCPNGHGEYQDKVITCADCGAPLVVSLPAALSATAEQQEPVCVGKFSFPHEAEVARTLLEAEGIECFIENGYTVNANWLWSNAVGGVRVMVKPGDEENAKLLLAEPTMADSSETTAEQGNEGHYAPKCPRCNSGDVSFRRSLKRLAALSLLVLGFPITVSRPRYHCNKCNAEWPDDPEDRA